MNRFPKAKAAGYMAAIFLCGAVAGWFIGFGFGKRSMFHAPPRQEDMVSHTCARLKSELSLSPEQELKIRPLIEQSSAQIHAVHTNSIARVVEVIAQSNRRVEEYLTAEQVKTFRELERKRQESFRNATHTHGPKR